MNTKKTWPIHCDELMLSMIAFCLESMQLMLKDTIKRGGPCDHSGEMRSKSQLRRDVQAANSILTQAYKGQVQLEKTGRKKRARRCLSK